MPSRQALALRALFPDLPQGLLKEIEFYLLLANFAFQSRYPALGSRQFFGLVPRQNS